MRRRGVRSRRGVTLAELILATGLAAIVMVSLVSVTDNAVRLWTRGEASRDSREVSSAVLGELNRDLRQLHPSSEGDLVIDWEPFDVERDGTNERLWPRLRFVRDASTAELATVQRRALAELAREARRLAAEGGDRRAQEAPEALTEIELLAAAGLTREELALGGGGVRDVDGSGLLEILYAVVPEGSSGPDRYTGALLRQERVHSAGAPRVLTGDGAFDSAGYPAAGPAQELARGVLWMRPLMATQTTVIDPGVSAEQGGWRISGGLRTAATSWDAWRRGRPDVELSEWNEPAPGMPAAGPRPALPRRIRLELETQSRRDRERAPRLLETIDEAQSSFSVTSGARLSRAIGQHVLVGGEWMILRSVTRDTATVRRGARGTPGRSLVEGTPIFFGRTSVIELEVPVHDDDWRLLPVEERGGAR
ncbi:MAG: hypothetical protein VX460_07885 [Planctomycetota bacterium]|nr:hypothetical protein [Planctomycetota bacterium]